jgi:spore germination cell wall hydrolase CwlJ-like protein
MLNETLASLVMSFMVSELPASEVDCLALNTYHEARDQSRLGMVAVSQVVLNRVKDPRYPSTICNVVHQQGFYDPPDAPIRLGECQFSWYCDGKSDAPTDETAWHEARANSAHAYYMYDVGYDITEGSTHYHSTSVSPNWLITKTRVVEIDDHIFYRWD